MLTLCLLGYVLFCFMLAAIWVRRVLHDRPVVDAVLWLSPLWFPVFAVAGVVYLLLGFFLDGVEAWPRAAKVMVTTPALCFDWFRSKFVKNQSHPAIDEALARRTLDELGVDVAREIDAVVREKGASDARG